MHVLCASSFTPMFPPHLCDLYLNYSVHDCKLVFTVAPPRLWSERKQLPTYNTCTPFITVNASTILQKPLYTFVDSILYNLWCNVVNVVAKRTRPWVTAGWCEEEQHHCRRKRDFNVGPLKFEYVSSQLPVSYDAFVVRFLTAPRVACQHSSHMQLTQWYVILMGLVGGMFGWPL